MTKISYTLTEVLDMFNLSRPTLRKEIRKGRLKAHKVGGKYIFYEEDIENFKKNIEVIPEKE